jgi:hypothetical protein
MVSQVANAHHKLSKKETLSRNKKRLIVKHFFCHKPMNEEGAEAGKSGVVNAHLWL